VCRRCFGAGYGIVLGGVNAFVPKDITETRLQNDRLYLLTQNIVRFIFFAIAVVSLLHFSVGAVIDLVEISSFDKIYSITNASAGSFMFWVGALAALYVYTSIERDSAGTTRVPIKVYRQTKKGRVHWRKTKAVDIYAVLTIEAKFQLLRAMQLARQQKTPFSIGHLFLTVSTTASVREMFARLGVVDIVSIRKVVARGLTQEQQNTRADAYQELKRVLESSYRETYEDRGKNIDIPSLFLATVLESPLVTEVLYDVNVDGQKIRNVVLWQENEQLLRRRYRHIRERSRFRPKGKLDRAMTALATPLLDHFSEDLTSAAQRGYFLPTIRRQEIINSALRIFEGGGAPLFVGDAGVGKKGVLEDIADRMVTSEVPANLQDKRLMSLLLPRVVSGVTPAEAGERVQRIIFEAARAGNIALVIDNAHSVHGITSGGEGSVDLAEVLASSLRRSGIPFLGTTTPEAYRKYMEGSSLASIFETVQVSEPTVDESIKIVQSRVALTEFKHHVYFSYDAIARLVELVDKFVPDRRLPKKALEVLDEVSLFVRKKRGEHSIVLRVDVDEFLSTKLNISVRQVDTNESALLLSFEDRVHERMIDQEEAVNAVADALRRARAEVRDVKRPIATLLFLGPTGVGKTELAKTVAALYFGDENKMVRLDMSEYQDVNSISRLLGTGRSGEAGTLTGAVRANPFSLVLLDELEKANANVLNLFLQVMDDGRLTSGDGETIDFTNVILIATSNAGAEYIVTSVREQIPFPDIDQHLRQEELGKHFQPEFLNRFDGVMIFKPLTEAHLLAITKLLLKKVEKRLAAHGIALQVTDAAIVELAKKGYDPVYGARPLRRTIQDNVDSRLARYLLDGQVKRRDTIVLDSNGEIGIIKGKTL